MVIEVDFGRSIAEQHSKVHNYQILLVQQVLMVMKLVGLIMKVQLEEQVHLVLIVLEMVV